jgi:Holliday junction resolvase
MYFDVDFKKEKPDWQGFEKATGDVFESFGYKTMRDVRFKTTQRFQIDLIAYNDKMAFFIDCKDHAYVAPQKEEEFMIKQRVRAENFVKINQKFVSLLKINLLVTKNRANSLIMHKDNVGKILSVDFNSLNELLTNIWMYVDELPSFR